MIRSFLVLLFTLPTFLYLIVLFFFLAPMAISKKEKAARVINRMRLRVISEEKRLRRAGVPDNRRWFVIGRAGTCKGFIYDSDTWPTNDTQTGTAQGGYVRSASLAMQFIDSIKPKGLARCYDNYTRPYDIWARDPIYGPSTLIPRICMAGPMPLTAINLYVELAGPLRRALINEQRRR